MSTLSRAPYGRILTGDKSSIFRFKMLKDDLFLILIHPKMHSSMGMFFEPGSDIAKCVEELYQEAITLWGDLLGAEFKLVGAEVLMKRALTIVSKYRWKQVGSSVRLKNSELVYYYYPARVRVADVLSESSAVQSDTLQFSPGNSAEKRNEKTRVLIVDDSKSVRVLLQQIFSLDPNIEVIGQADRPSEAEKMIQLLKPDVMTLDIHMPEMDGVSFLKTLLPRYPIPTVLLSSISIEEGRTVLDGLESGAVDYIQKPSLNEIEQVAPMMIEKIKHAALAKVMIPQNRSHRHFSYTGEIDFNRVILIGSSTGGTEALRILLSSLPENIPPIVIVQHIPPVFSKAFADRMNSICSFEVKEAEQGDELLASRVLIAPGATQMKLLKSPKGLCVHIDPGAEPVNRHKPSVDHLFFSAAELLGKRAVGVILTGMGADGAKGLQKMKIAGAATVAQDEKSCVVFGMPREAIKIGAAEKVLPLENIGAELMRLISLRKAA